MTIVNQPREMLANVTTIQETAISDSFAEISGTKSQSGQNTVTTGAENFTQNDGSDNDAPRPKIDMTADADTGVPGDRISG